MVLGHEIVQGNGQTALVTPLLVLETQEQDNVVFVVRLFIDVPALNSMGGVGMHLPRPHSALSSIGLQFSTVYPLLKAHTDFGFSLFPKARLYWDGIYLYRYGACGRHVCVERWPPFHLDLGV